MWLLQDHSRCKEQHCGTDLNHPGDVFNPDFQYLKACFDVIVNHTLQDSLLWFSAATAGVTAKQEEPDKDSHYAADVQAAGGIVCSFGGGVSWSLIPYQFSCSHRHNPVNLSKSGVSATLASCHF